MVPKFIYVDLFFHFQEYCRKWMTVLYYKVSLQLIIISIIQYTAGFRFAIYELLFPTYLWQHWNVVVFKV